MTTPTGNVVIGRWAAYKCTVTGGQNFIVGSCAGCAITSGYNNILLGQNTGRSGVLTGGDNTVIGSQAGYAISSGSCNILIGRDNGQNITTGSRNISIGKDVDPPAADGNDTLQIGCGTSRWISGDSSFNITTNTITPASNNTYNLGSTGTRWANIYTNDLQLSNKGKTNDVDGTWGDFTIQEGENDLFLINNRSGKKYKFNLTEVS